MSEGGGQIIGSLTTQFGNLAPRHGWKIMEISNNKDMAKIYRIRKLTARECFRLMALKDNEIDDIQASGISESQQYKLAGNSIVVDTLLHGIYINLFLKDGIPEGQLF